MSEYCYQDGLESERLCTKWLNEDMSRSWANFFKDEEAVAYVPNFNLPSVEETASFWIERQMGRYADKRYGLQALIEKSTGQFIGICGLLTQEVDGIEELEVGYHILKQYWGNGFAPEAARLFIDYAVQNKLAESVISIIDVDNVKSQRVAEKNGLQREKATQWGGLDIYIYRIKI